MKKFAKFFDEEDFTPTHDEIFIWLLENWKEVVQKLEGNDAVASSGSITGEPYLEGYPPLFPDAIATGNFSYDHRKKPLLLMWNRDIDGTFLLECQGCERRTDAKNYNRFDFDFPKIEDIPAYQLVQYEYGKERSRLREEYLVAKRQAFDEWRQNFQSPYWTDLCRGGSFRCIFEIKPKVESFGKVLRQLRLYKSRAGYHEHNRLVLVTYDNRYDLQFQEQGFHTYHPTEVKGNDSKLVQNLLG